MRTLIENRVIKLLFNNCAVIDYASNISTNELDRLQTNIFTIVQSINDKMLFSLFIRLSNKDQILPLSIDDDGNYLALKINDFFGAMIEDGSIHT